VLIQSPQNPKIKQFKKWQEKSRDRKRDGVFLAEGLQEAELAYKAGFEIQTVLYCPELISLDKVQSIIPVESGAEYLGCILDLMNDLLVRKGMENFMFVGKHKNHDLEKVNVPEKASFLICESIEKPGNLGAIARSAHAFGMDAIILANPLCDMYNPNAIRSSTGSVFSVPLYVGSNEEVKTFLKANKVETYITNMHAQAKSLRELKIAQKAAFVIGTEHSGLSDDWTGENYTNVIIPMQSSIDSLNASNAAAVIMYEISIQNAKSQG